MGGKSNGYREREIPMPAAKWLSRRVFEFVHSHNLVYNTCWEDPRLDRQAMQLGPEDRVLVITSAGCNALDYVLAGAGRVYAVDMNPRQNALLELKIAGIRQLAWDDFFQMFGQGHLPHVRQVYRQRLRGQLSVWSQRYWDRWISFFSRPSRPFYFRGTSGSFARALNFYIDRVVKVRPIVDQLLASKSLVDQRKLYYEELRGRFWTRALRFALRRDATLSMVGVPEAQRLQVERHYPGGIVQFIEESLDAVFAQLPLHDNYFWRVYMTGSYSPECCPEYLKPQNFERLKSGLVDRTSCHTNTIQGFLDQETVSISRFVLLDHMDWLSTHNFSLLEAEWSAILQRATPGARLLWRSGGLRTDFVDQVVVRQNGRLTRLPELLRYDRELASRLHSLDRVHTYGSFYIADVAA